MPGIAAIISQPNSESLLASREITIEGFEQFRAAAPTTQSEIIQIEAGRMYGRLKHATVAGLSLGFGTFSHGLVSRGVYSKERVTIGFLFDDSKGRSRLRGPRSIRIWSPGAEHESRYNSGTSFAAISASVDDVAQVFGSDSRFSEPSAWRESKSFRADGQTGAAAAHALRSIMSSFDRRGLKISRGEAEFWKRAILEAATAVVAGAEGSDEFVASPARLVRRAQAFIEASGAAPLHISQLLAALRVSRRSLHRAFDEVLGMPPITYLRHKRLCEARILLKQGTERGVTVADVAFRQGFSDLGRFAGYYRSLFGENPSDSLLSTRLKAP